MADLVPAWAHDGERREPTADEIETGFGCGPFSLPLWNWMFYALWSEIGHVIAYNGLTPDNGDMEQLRKAIQAQIDASTGGGDPESYLTLLQASARLPIFPDVQTTTGHFGVTSSTGQVTVPAGVSFLHRGISPYTSALTIIATDASKTYHLRWNKTDGFTLKDLASGVYNPSALVDGNAAFDSTYDDMLVARVITNSSNVPTVTNLANRSQLSIAELLQGQNMQASGSANKFDFVKAINWGRRPANWSLALAHGSNDGAITDNDFNITPLGTAFSSMGQAPQWVIDRYQLSQTVLRDDTTVLWMHFDARA